LTQFSLIYHTEPRTKKIGKAKKTTNENGYAQKYWQTVRGVREVSPEEKEGYEGKDLPKNKGFKPGVKRRGSDG